MKRERLRAALDALEREGALAPAHRGRIEERIAVELFPPVDRRGRLAAIVGVLGAILVGVGILYFVALHWDDLGKGSKMALVFGAWLAIHFGAFLLGERPGNRPRMGHALTALGVLAFGGAVYLVVQIYHLPVREPWPILLWWLANLPFAFLKRSPWILSILLVLFSIWLPWQSWEYLEEKVNPEKPTGVASFVVLAAAASALFLSLGRLLGGPRGDPFARPLRALAVLIGLGIPYALSFKGFWENEVAASPPPGAFLPSALVAAAAILAALFAFRERRGRLGVLEPAAVLGAGVLLGAALLAAPQSVYLLANAVLLVGIVALVARGVQAQEAFDVHAGIAAFLLAVMTRYFEYLHDRANAVLVFLGAGALLLGLGFVLERKRRSWLGKGEVAG